MTFFFFSFSHGLKNSFPFIDSGGRAFLSPALGSHGEPNKRGGTLVALSCMFVHWSRDEKGLGVSRASSTGAARSKREERGKQTRFICFLFLFNYRLLTMFSHL